MSTWAGFGHGQILIETATHFLHNKWICHKIVNSLLITWQIPSDFFGSSYFEFTWYYWHQTVHTKVNTSMRHSVWKRLNDRKWIILICTQCHFNYKIHWNIAHPGRLNNLFIYVKAHNIMIWNLPTHSILLYSKNILGFFI